MSAIDRFREKYTHINDKTLFQAIDDGDKELVIDILREGTVHPVAIGAVIEALSDRGVKCDDLVKPYLNHHKAFVKEAAEWYFEEDDDDDV